jgi:[acyl-carrier-protein] S-malonyltransferase
MSLAFIFPGQGSQYPGMGKFLIKTSEAARRIFEEADEVLGFNLSGICFEGDEATIKQTEVTQPAVMTCSLATLQILRERGLLASVVTGHSLGEYSALVCAESLSFAEALKLVQVRAKAMSQASKSQPCTMAAIIGLEAESVATICKEASEVGIVCAANYNGPGQIVISGETAAVQRAMELSKNAGAKRCIQLPVSGAFHSPLMKSAEAELKAAIKDVKILPPKIPFVSNVTASFETDPNRIKELLVAQISKAVLWDNSIRHLAKIGISKFLEVGPGKVLSGLVRRIQPTAETFTTDSVEEIEKIGKHEPSTKP